MDSRERLERTVSSLASDRPNHAHTTEACFEADCEEASSRIEGDRQGHRAGRLVDDGSCIHCDDATLFSCLGWRTSTEFQLAVVVCLCDLGKAQVCNC